MCAIPFGCDSTSMTEKLCFTCIMVMFSFTSTSPIFKGVNQSDENDEQVPNERLKKDKVIFDNNFMNYVEKTLFFHTFL